MFLKSIFFTPLFILFFLYSVFAWADTKPVYAPKGDFTRLSLSGVGIVAQAVDGQTLSLKDGRIVRLSGVEIPDAFSEKPSHVAIAAKSILDATLKNREIRIYISKDKTWQQSRYGHILAQIEDKITSAWLQGVLVSNGFARVDPTFPMTHLTQDLLKLEQEARQQNRGLWADKIYAIRTPANITDDIGTTQLVEGIVKSTATVNNVVYLNFGDNWRKDFTIIINAQQRQALVKKMLNPLSFTGQRIRIRGLIIEQNGPAIQLNAAAQLEIIK